jgi:hypothetical protein
MTSIDAHRRDAEDAEKEYYCSNLKLLMPQDVFMMIPGFDFVLIFFYLR